MFLWRLSVSKAQVEMRTSIKTSKQEYMYLNSKKAIKENNVIKKHTK